jgi:hypothetical protein
MGVAPQLDKLQLINQEYLMEERSIIDYHLCDDAPRVPLEVQVEAFEKSNRSRY